MTGHADIAELLKQDWAQRLCITRCATFFSARCTIVQSAVLRSHVVCLSVRPSVTLVDHDHVVLGWRPWKLNCTVKIIANTFAFRSPGGTWGNFGETRGGARKTLLSLTLVRLCEETWETSRGYLCDSTAFLFYLHNRRQDHLWQSKRANRQVIYYNWFNLIVTYHSTYRMCINA